MSKPSRWRKRVWGTLQWTAAIALILAVTLSGRWFVKAQLTASFDVYLDDIRIGTVHDPEVIKTWKHERYMEMEKNYEPLRVTSNLERLHFVSNKAFRGDVDHDADAVVSALTRYAEYAFFASEIRIDGQTVGYVKDMSSALELLEQIKDRYGSGQRKAVRALSSDRAHGESEGEKVSVSSSFLQEVQLVESQVEPEAIESLEAVRERIEAGSVVPQSYTAENGDSMWLIARKYGMPLQTLREYNPQIKNDLIRVGQMVNIRVRQPLLAVRTTELRSEQVKVPSGMTVEKDDSLKAGVMQVVFQGKEGLKKVTIQSVSIGGRLIEERTVAEEVVEKPVHAVVKQGTKVIPGVGTGRFALPVLHGEVSSEFGQRWGTAHNGTDFVSEQRAILASDHGKVTFAGWKSGYGNCVIIDHQNGYETLYGHLSQIAVREGEKVSKGEKIGMMGSTGNSTGVHLHFEIIKDGAQQNPMKYLG